MNYLLKRAADAHADDPPRRPDCTTQGFRAGGSTPRRACADGAVTLRVAAPDDTPALRRLAALDSSAVPAGPVLLVEVGGELRAAMSLTDHAVIANPFQPTAALVQLLVKRAEQVLSDPASRLRRMVRAVTGGVRPRRQTPKTTPLPELR